MADSWKKIWNDLKRLHTDDSYRWLAPLLEQLEPVINTQRYDPSSVRAVLTLVERIHKRRQAGGVEDAVDLISDLAIGITNKDVEIEGSLVQANRDVVFQVFQTALPGLKQADNSIPVAVVVVAMTKAEAAELASEQAFNRQLDVLREDFRRLSLYLKSKGWDLWPQHYGAKAEHWKPRGQQRIEDLTRDIMKRVNDEKRGEWKPLRPRFHDIRLLDSATPDGRRLLRRLRAQGCMVIIDSISMRHPALLRAYQISLLDVFPNTSVISLAQNEETFDLMRDMVHALQMTFKESELHFRQRDPMERQACQAYTDWEKAEPWFVNRLMTVYGERAKESGVRSQIKYDS